MEIVFTGTRKGMNDIQLSEVRDIIDRASANNKCATVHHGACIGADEQFHEIALEHNCEVFIYPAREVGNPVRAECKNGINYWDSQGQEMPKDFLLRNRIMLDAVWHDSYGFMLIATPNTSSEVQRSGTWSTVRYARKLNGVLVTIVLPTGPVFTELINVY